jgi:hypothetical protein
MNGTEGQTCGAIACAHGTELVVLPVEGYALPRQNRKLAFTRADIPVAKLERTANCQIYAEHAGLDALMDD